MGIQGSNHTYVLFTLCSSIYRPWLHFPSSEEVSLFIYFSLSLSLLLSLAQNFRSIQPKQLLTCALYFNIRMKGQFVLFFMRDDVCLFSSCFDVNIFHIKLFRLNNSHTDFHVVASRFSAAIEMVWIVATAACVDFNYSWNFEMIFINNIKLLNVIRWRFYGIYLPNAICKEWQLEDTVG